MKISQILEDALQHLATGSQDTWYRDTVECVDSDDYKELFSCNAIKAVGPWVPLDQIFTGLERMGLRCGSSYEFPLSEFESREQRQYARALWLTWAALMAEEQGV
jgi:hypothetical protein